MSIDLQKLNELIDLVPKQESDKMEYIKNAIIKQNAILQNDVNENQVGGRISHNLAETIIARNYCAPTRAVFFSISKIIQSISNADNASFEDVVSNGGLAVIFGRYSEIYDPEFGDLGVDPNEYINNYAGRNTVVLKYVDNVNDRNANLLVDAQGVIIDNLGKTCPNWCNNLI